MWLSDNKRGPKEIIHRHGRIEFTSNDNVIFLFQTPEELEDVSDLEEDHDTHSRTSIQTEGKTDRVSMEKTECLYSVSLNALS